MKFIQSLALQRLTGWLGAHHHVQEEGGEGGEHYTLHVTCPKKQQLLVVVLVGRGSVINEAYPF